MYRIELMSRKIELERLREFVRKCQPNLIPEMDEAQVAMWLKRVNPSGWFRLDLDGFNGSLLNQLYKLKNQCPEFFYSKLEKINSKPLKVLLEFSKNLDDLFTGRYYNSLTNMS